MHKHRIDTRDEAIIADRLAKMDAMPGPRVGDFVRFTDGTKRRISYLWPDGAQTSSGGSFYLGNYGCSFSGGLYPSIPFDKLHRTDEQIEAGAWIFHHDHVTAHNGVDFQIPFRVYNADCEPNR